MGTTNFVCLGNTSLSRSSSVTPASRQGSFANFYDYAHTKNRELSRADSRSSMYQPVSRTSYVHTRGGLHHKSHKYRSRTSMYNGDSAYSGGLQLNHSSSRSHLPTIDYTREYTRYSSYARPTSYTSALYGGTTYGTVSAQFVIC
jgi:hypothetical protein